MRISLSARRVFGSDASRFAFLAGTPGLLFIFFMFLLPISYMAWRSVSDPVLGLVNYTFLFGSSAYVKVILKTVWISLLCTVMCAVIGTPVAYLIAHFPAARMARIALLCIVASFLMSSLVRAFAWMALLGTNGPVIGVLGVVGIKITTLLSTTTGVVIGMVHFLLPIYILVLFNGLRVLPINLVLAAEGMGASHWYAIRTVYAPMAVYALMNAGSVIFVLSVGFFITPALLGGAKDMMLAQLIAQSVSRFGDFGLAAAAGFVLLVITLSVIFLSKRLFRRVY